MTAALTVQPRRRVGLLRRMFGRSADEFPPVAPNRWRAERVFPTRWDIVDRLGETLPALVDELREQVGAAWPPTRQ